MANDPPAGWYPDPDDPARARYWDGRAWTDYTGPRDASGQPRTPPPDGSPPEDAVAQGGTPTVPPPQGDARAVAVDPPRRLGGVAWFAFVVLALMVLAAAIQIPIALNYADKVQTQIDDRSLTYHQATDAEDAFVLGSGAFGIVSLAVIIAFLIWWYRAYSNIPGVTGQRWRFGRGWSIGAWFIPIFNLWRPKQIGNDIWRAGDPRAWGNSNWTALPVASLVNWWWALFVLSSILGGIAGALLNGSSVLSDSVPHHGLGPGQLTAESTLRQEHAAAVINAAAAAIEVFAAVAAILFIRRASERQDGQMAEAERAQAAT